MERHYSALDQILINVDRAMTTVFGRPPSERANPANPVQESELSDSQRRLSQGMMRVNHAGEVCAQALYQGQAITARNDSVRQRMQQASMEENDHLAWCEQRLQELGSHTSYLNPAWYAGSFVIGTVAGIIGDRWNLGFVAETERQVVRHLQRHLEILPEQDLKSRAIVEQMQIDEGEHAIMAVSAGAAELPIPVKKLMGLSSKLMTETAYYL